MYSRVFGSSRIDKPVLKIFDKTVWLWRRADALLPWPGLSLILVARNAEGATAPESSDRIQAVPQGISRQ